jgi:hypothetical protein
LRGHSASTAAAKTAATTAAAETSAAAAVAASTAAEAATITVTAAAAAAVAAALLETTAELGNTLFAKTIALVATATTALTFAPSIETHIRPNLNCPLTPETNALGQKGATGHDA